VAESLVDTLTAAATALAKLLRSAIRNRSSIASHRYYAPKVRSSLAALRKSFLRLQREYPKERFPGVAFHLATIEPSVRRIVEMFPAEPREMVRLLDDISFKLQSDLAAELEAPEATPLSPSAPPPPPFLPNDLIEDRHGVLRKILWEINRSYDTACYNSCAAMVRRLVESLIVEAFEHHGIADKIKNDAAYLPFNALIGKAGAEAKLRLTQNTKRLLPDLKFLGDMGAHNRMALVRKDDLDRLHNGIRAGIEELARNL
jgi:hypothetical protein